MRLDRRCNISAIWVTLKTRALAAVNSIKTHLFEGGLLAALVVFLFLWNFRSTMIAAIAIPTSIIATFGLMAERVLAAAARLCEGRLVASHEGGYSEGHVPFCGVSVIEAMSGLTAGIDDPFAYLAAVPGQELLPHQRAAIDAAAALVAGVPR